MQPFELLRYCPRCGRPSATTKAAIPFHCTGCDLELYFNPTVSASAFIRRDDGQVLLIRRAKEPARGRLATIGGFVDMGESAEEALRREIREEVNLEITPPEFLTSHPNYYHYAGVTYPVLDLFFVCRTVSPGHAHAGDDVLSMVWQNVADINAGDLAFDSMKKALLILQSMPAD
jgi:ADP-ribose pyrophosphatase YjhB (NUDIX family)